MDIHEERFAGIRRLYGTEAAQRIRTSHFCIIGVGGVGSWTAEALARTGVGAITLVDLDDICVSNTNRQIHALTSTLGQSKIHAMAERIMDIHPHCQVHQELDFLTPENARRILSQPFDVIIDAIDSAKHKCAILSTTRDLAKQLVTVGGAGGRRDPTQWTVSDLNRTQNDALLLRVRKTLRQKFGFPRGATPWGIPCVHTTEAPIYPTPDGDIGAIRRPDSPLRLDCSEGYGASTAVTGTAGFLAASTAIDVLLGTAQL